MNHKELLFGFLRSVVCGGQVTEEMKNASTRINPLRTIVGIEFLPSRGLNSTNPLTRAAI